MTGENASKEPSTKTHHEPSVSQQNSSPPEEIALFAPDSQGLINQALKLPRISTEVVLSLQRRYGNHFVQRLLSRQPASQNTGAEQSGRNPLKSKIETQELPEDTSHQSQKPALQSFSRSTNETLQRTITYWTGMKFRSMQSSEDPMEIFGSETLFQWYVAQVIEAGKTDGDVSTALIAMRDDTTKTWKFDKANKPLIDAFFGEIDRSIGLNGTWDYEKYKKEEMQPRQGSASEKKPLNKREPKGKEIAPSSRFEPKNRREKTKSEESQSTKQPSSKEQLPLKQSAPVIDEGNVLGPFVHPTKERNIECEVKGLTGNPIRTIYVSSDEKKYLDEMYRLATETMEEEEYPTWGELKHERISDEARVGFEIELKGMYIHVSERPDVAAAMAIAGHKPLAESGNIQIHIDAASGSGVALIEIVTEPLFIDEVETELIAIKSKIGDKETLLNWIAGFRQGEKESKEEEAEVVSEKEETEEKIKTPKNLILDFILNDETKIDYSQSPVHVQLTTSLTEEEFAGTIAEHTQFKKHKSNKGTLANALKNTDPKTSTNKHGYALIKHAYEQLAEANENTIPEETRVDKVPFKYESGAAEGKANLHTEANKISKLIDRNKKRAFLVEYRGGNASRKHFIGDIKKYLEGKEDKIEAVIGSIQDAFPHLKPQSKD